MWRTEPALTDVQVVDFLRQQGWTWDPSRLKYLDESHFENWDCSRWQYCRAPRGERVTRTRHIVCSSSVEDVYSPVT
eukprot:g23736.t1